MSIDKDDPQNPAGDRFTGERFEKVIQRVDQLEELGLPGVSHA
ncbi:hypothetical protein [Streptomyces sp. NPDC045714]